MSRDAGPASVLIGPNAILQLLPVLDSRIGSRRRAQILAAAGIAHVPDGRSMIPQTDAARLHRQLRYEEPALAPVLAAHAGFETANYILAHRIPKPAQWLLKALPKEVSAALLSRAIARHAWTFVGSGRLHVVDRWTFDIENNPLIEGEVSERCLCDWHVGVFARLYQSLVSRDCICAETCCAAQRRADRCRFQLRCPKAGERRWGRMA